MKNVKILHLYSDSLDLYGDAKNLTALVSRIKETGNTAEISYLENFEELDFSGYDLVYIGHGKAKNLAAVSKHFVSFKDKIISAIENGQVWFCTGNSRELFGKSFTTVSGETLESIGLFDYEGVETNKVFVSDMLASPVFSDTDYCYGFANRTAYLKGENKYPLFKVINGFSDGDTPTGDEGTLYKNFFATWSMGPALIRNPILMKEILKRILGSDYRDCAFSLEEKALAAVKSEFK